MQSGVVRLVTLEDLNDSCNLSGIGRNRLVLLGPGDELDYSKLKDRMQLTRQDRQFQTWHVVNVKCNTFACLISTMLTLLFYWRS